jgi:hypothetical protein
MIAEAMANGTWMPQGGNRDIGEKPALFEAYLADTKAVAANKAGQEEFDWDAIMASRFRLTPVL